MQQVYSPKQVARALGASESSVKRWCDRGILPSVRTGGGHRRVPLAAVLSFVRSENRSVVSPSELGLPPEVSTPQQDSESARKEFQESLQQGNFTTCRGIILSLHMAHKSMAEICDATIAPAMHAIGEGWCDGTVEVFEERQGCEVTLRLLHELRSLIPAPSPDAPLALGASSEGDPYCLPTRMVELVLLEAGWNASSLGCDIPLSSLKRAIESKAPRLFWLSVSDVVDRDFFVQEYMDMYLACDDVAVVLGGRALDENLRSRIQFSSYCEGMRRLDEFAKAIYRKPST